MIQRIFTWSILVALSFVTLLSCRQQTEEKPKPTELVRGVDWPNDNPRPIPKTTEAELISLINKGNHWPCDSPDLRIYQSGQSYIYYLKCPSSERFYHLDDLTKAKGLNRVGPKLIIIYADQGVASFRQQTYYLVVKTMLVE